MVALLKTTSVSFITYKYHLASINVNGATVHSALGLWCCGKLFPLDSNMLCAFRNKYAEVVLIILHEILIVFY